MRMIVLSLAVLLTGAGQPPLPPSGDPPGPPPTMDRDLAEDMGSGAFARLLAANGMSAAGIASLTAAPKLGRPDPAATGAVGKETEAAMTSGDPDRIAAALARRDARMAAAAEARTAALVGYLRPLSPADRQVLLKVLGPGAAGGPGFGPPPGGPGGPGFGPPPPPDDAGRPGRCPPPSGA